MKPAGISLSRRRALALLSAAAARPQAIFGQTPAPLAEPFTADLSSLRRYRTPAWFADAKFGIWAHWGPQSGIEQGDWFARLMYMPGTPQYEWHLRHFGHPSKTGYKDLVPLFKASAWDPDALIDLYVNAGARYFVSMGVHCDNYDMWNSRFQPRWNAAAIGPRRDIVGEWKVAARKRGLRFGVSEHLSNSFDWLAPAHLSDTSGPLAGVPYDGTDPAFADLYHDYTGVPLSTARSVDAMSRVAPQRWKQQWLRRIEDLIAQHQPDLLYTDGGIAFQPLGFAEPAGLYNISARRHDGHNEAVFTGKDPAECGHSVCTLDRERAVGDAIRPDPWQTDTCIGNWHYQQGLQYKPAKKIIDMLVDIVSKNGNLLLNFPLPNSGVLDPEERRILAEITAWMQTNGEALYATRPWTVYGDGPAFQAAREYASAPVQVGAGFNENDKPALGPTDIRFTTKGRSVYAFAHGWPGATLLIPALGSGSPQHPPRITSATLLGTPGLLRYQQRPEGLLLHLPTQKPATADLAIAFRLTT